MGLADWLAVRMKPEAQVQVGQTRAKLLNDPYYRFQSVDEIQLAATLGISIDANLAGVDDWLRLPGLSIHQARSLVCLTQSGVQFHCLEDVAAALGLPLQRLKPLAPVLRFCYYDPASPTALPTLNVNTASVEALTRVPAVDLFLARAIAQNRQQYGPYRNLAEMQRRLTLPPAITAELMHYLNFS